MGIIYGFNGQVSHNHVAFGIYSIERKGRDRYEVFYRGREEPFQRKDSIGVSEVDRTLAQMVTRHAQDRTHIPQVRFGSSIPNDKLKSITNLIFVELTRERRGLESNIDSQRNY